MAHPQDDRWSFRGGQRGDEGAATVMDEGRHLAGRHLEERLHEGRHLEGRLHEGRLHEGRHLSGERLPHEGPLHSRMRQLHLEECARGSFSDADSDDERRHGEWKHEALAEGAVAADLGACGDMGDGASNPALPLKKRLPPSETAIPWAANQLPPETLTAFYRCKLSLHRIGASKYMR